MSKIVRSYRSYRINISRTAIGIVLLLNVQCAIQFLASPSVYLPGFGLTGIPGEFALRGMAVLFFMWNVPYVFALIHPEKYRVSYLQAVIMQTIGLVGEFILVITLPTGYPTINASLTRFILFDGVGLVFILAGYLIIPKPEFES